MSIQLLTFFLERRQCFHDSGHCRFEVGEEDIVDD